MCKNPHFRVLALTATPGNKAEAVQEIVNTLHISHIEIRNENSMDLREYIHKKVHGLLLHLRTHCSLLIALMQQVKTHVIEMTPAIMEIHNLMVKIMKVGLALRLHDRTPTNQHRLCALEKIRPNQQSGIAVLPECCEHTSFPVHIG